MKPPALEKIYLDAANAAPLAEEVREAMLDALHQWGNPSSLHAPGRAAAAAIQKARENVAALIQARPSEIIFTSCGTEANAMALWGLAKAYETRGKHLIVSAIEHLSILQLARRMEKEGWKVTVIPVDEKGRVDRKKLEETVTPQTVLASIQWANGEVGTIQPLAPLVKFLKARGVIVHTDAVAAVGQIPIDVREVPVDALSMAANTFGGPSGVGALYVRKGVRILPLLVGGTQEGGRRSGTENGVGMVGMGEAARLAREEISLLKERLIPLRDRLIHGILNKIQKISLNGDPTERLPGHVSVSIPGLEAESLVLSLDMEGVAVGLGSACTASTMKASHVLKAMGVEETRARATITCTLSRQTTRADLDRFLEILPEVVLAQRRRSEK